LTYQELVSNLKECALYGNKRRICALAAAAIETLTQENEQIRQHTVTHETHSLIVNEHIANAERLKDALAECKNELCLKCGTYRYGHEGACNGCKWKH
jgi:hypothetical protein